LFAWLDICMDQHGFSRLFGHEGHSRVAQWLSDRPDRLKAVVWLGWHALPKGELDYWERLHGARLPRDWLRWLLAQAAETSNEKLAQYCFAKAAQAAIDPPPGFDVPTMEQIEDWVKANAQRWPDGGQWLRDKWSSSIEDDNMENHTYRRQRKHKAELLAKREERRKALAPHLDAIMAGTAPVQLMHQLAGAYEARFHDIRGDTPEQRVQDFLRSDEDTAHAAIAGLRHVLQRDDLPSHNEVLRLGAQGKYDFLQPAALLAARLTHAREPEAVATWPDALLATLVAYWLTEGLAPIPDWYREVVSSRPELVAPLWVRYALSCLRGPVTARVVELTHAPEHAALLALVLSPLLEGFPQRASESALENLNRALLSALHLLDDATASAIVRRKLDHSTINPAQRICWLVADLAYSADAAQRLVELVGKNERRASVLGRALNEQASLSRMLQRVPAATLSSLIALLAPITQPGHPQGAYQVTPEHQRRDTVSALITLLASDPQPDATQALQQLASLPRMGAWHPTIRYHLLEQQTAAREANYVHPSPEATALALANCAPANHADLMALTLDHLHEIGLHLRGADTSEWKLYWEKNAQNTWVPKDENDCRNLLLTVLRNRLRPLSITVTPERLAANDKRADLRIDFKHGNRPLALPIEIKKENNQQLWLAWSEQLKAFYATEPSTWCCGSATRRAPRPRVKNPLMPQTCRRA
jgi:hypothetical protein